MTETTTPQPATAHEPSSTYASVTHDGFSVSSNSETKEDIAANFEAEPKPLDGEPPDPEKEEEEEAKKAAKALGRRGGKAAAEKRAAEGEADADADEGEAKAEEDKGKKDRRGDPRHDPVARMKEATRQAAEVKRENAELKRRLEALERSRYEPPPQPAQQPAGDGEPQEENYERHLDYLKDHARWVARREAQDIVQRERQQYETQARVAQFAQALDHRMHSVAAQFQKAQDADPEIMDRMSPDILGLTPSFALPPGQRPGLANVLADEIFSSDDAPRLMLHLSEHPDDFQRLATLTPRALVREIARIETRLDAATPGKPAPAPVSKAKPPIRPVSGSPQAADPYEVTDDDDLDAHIRKLNALDFKRRRSGTL